LTLAENSWDSRICRGSGDADVSCLLAMPVNRLISLSTFWQLTEKHWTPPHMNPSSLMLFQRCRRIDVIDWEILIGLK
jgi:hypothetical protein